MRTTRLLIVTLLLALAVPVGARAQTAATLAIDDVRVGAHRRHVVLVRAEDAAGQPVPHLQTTFSARLDGAGVRDLVVRAPFDDGVKAGVVIVVDADLLSSGIRHDLMQTTQALMRAVAGALPADDRVMVIAASRSPRRLERAASDLRTGASDLEPLAAPAAGRLMETLDAAVALASKRRLHGPGIVAVITRGGDGNDNGRASSVLAHAGGGTAIVVARIGAPGRSPLAALAEQTNGRALVFEHPGDDVAPFGAAVRALRGRYELAFLPGAWDGGVATHRVEVKLDAGAGGLVAHRDYRLADVSEAPWWASPWPWLVLVLVVVAGGFALLRLRPRPVAMLVFEGGEEDGAYFELFTLPVTIGCAEGCDILVTGEGVSRNHCVLQLNQGRFELMDANSTGGTYVQGQRIGKRVLEDDDVIRLGTEVALVFEDHR